MTSKYNSVTEQSGPTTSAASWDLRHPGLVMKGANGEEIHEFTGMWPLKPDADLVDMENALSREAPFWGGPGKTFSEATTMLGLIRTARWFVGTSTEFGPTLYFISQFDSSLEKYFDDFVLNGKGNLEKAWGNCIGCPDWPGHDGARHRELHRTRADQDPGLLRRASEPELGPDPEDGRLVREDAEVPAHGGQRRRQP